jgi:hypothetical protein
VAALFGGFELLAVEFAGIDLVVVEGLEGRGMAAGIDRPDIPVWVEPALRSP